MHALSAVSAIKISHVLRLSLPPCRVRGFEAEDKGAAIALVSRLVCMVIDLLAGSHGSACEV
jgi:hypothetical protein